MKLNAKLPQIRIDSKVKKAIEDKAKQDGRKLSDFVRLVLLKAVITKK